MTEFEHYEQLIAKRMKEELDLVSSGGEKLVDSIDMFGIDGREQEAIHAIDEFDKCLSIASHLWKTRSGPAGCMSLETVFEFVKAHRLKHA